MGDVISAQERFKDNAKSAVLVDLSAEEIRTLCALAEKAIALKIGLWSGAGAIEKRARSFAFIGSLPNHLKMYDMLIEKSQRSDRFFYELVGGNGGLITFEDFHKLAQFIESVIEQARQNYAEPKIPRGIE